MYYLDLILLKIIPFSLVILLIIFIFWKFNHKVKIKYKTFLKKGFAPRRGNFGVYCYDGKQGKGKTYSIVEYLIDNKNDITIFCNIANITNINYFHFTGFNELLKLKKIIDYNYKDYEDLKAFIYEQFKDENRTIQLFELLKDCYENGKQIVFVYDEIFTEFEKKSKLDKDVIDFLCQMRKRKIIFLTTAQEWAEIPLTFRRFCRYEIRCNMINFLGIGLLFKEFNDAENMKWSDEQQEHVAPLLETTLTHCRKEIANSYDTFLRISSVGVEAPTGEKK